MPPGPVTVTGTVHYSRLVSSVGEYLNVPREEWEPVLVSSHITTFTFLPRGPDSRTTPDDPRPGCPRGLHLGGDVGPVLLGLYGFVSREQGDAAVVNTTAVFGPHAAVDVGPVSLSLVYLERRDSNADFASAGYDETGPGRVPPCRGTGTGQRQADASAAESRSCSQEK